MQTQPALITKTIPLPAWVPPPIRSALAGQELDLRLPRQVRARLRRPEKIGGADWAARYRTVTDGAHEGPWRHEYAPHTVKIMDTFTRPWVREVWFCGVEQSGKTNTMLNALGWCIDCDPGNIFYLMPTEKDADKITGGKLKPVLARSPRLARYLSERQDDTTLARIHLSHGVTIFPAHANSASALATWAAKHCFGDEVDKYPAMVGKEADPITLIKKRNRTYRGRYKRFFASTPAGRFIQAGTYNCHQVWQYRERCPDCSAQVKLTAEHLVLPEGATPESVERDGARVACPECGAVWDDRRREQAIRAGGWVCVKGADYTRPATVGFHHRAWDCLDISLAEIAAAWLKAETGGVAEKVAWANGYEAINYERAVVARQAEDILALKDDRPELVVPSWALCLLLTADVQKNGIWYEIRAWGEQDSACIRYGYLAAGLLEPAAHRLAGDFAALATVARQIYHDPEGREYQIRFGLVDSGYRTDETYNFCRQIGFLAPSKGADAKAVPITYSKIDTLPGTGRLIPGGIQLVRYDANFFKDALALVLQVKPGDPGAWQLHATVGEDYARQYTAETLDEEKKVWVQRGNQPNHLWDCGMMQMVARRIIETQGLLARLLQERAQTISPPPPATPQKPTPPGAQKLW